MMAEACATVMRSVGVKCEWKYFMPVFDQADQPISERIAVALSGFEVTGG
jgi:hypothetical protein